MREHDISGIKKFLYDFVKNNICLAVGKSDVEANLRMKYSHILAVHTLARMLAAELRLDNQTTFQVRAAALLHDIGRFPQIIESQTYEDAKSINHADLGVKIIQENRLLNHFGTDVAQAIEIAVRHHNKLALPSEIVGKYRAIAETLRDADKIDITRIAIKFHAAELKGKKTEWYTEMLFSPTCNRIAVEALLAGKAVPIAEIATVYDEFLLYLSWVNDFHFDVSVRHLVKLKRIEYMVNSLPGDTLRARVAEYINKRLVERCSIKV